jgi:AcrR family transcriptional regulator
MPTGPLRAIHAQETRERLTEAALVLFERHGFDGVTVEEIAAAATVSARTFYRYFGSKEGALFDQQDELLAVLHATIVTERPDEPPIAAVRAAIVTLTQHTAHLVTTQRRQAAIYLATPSLGAYERTVIRPRWEETLVGAIAERLSVDPAIDSRPGLLAGAAIAVMDAVMNAWMRTPVDADLADLVETHFRLLGEVVAQQDHDSRPQGPDA